MSLKRFWDSPMFVITVIICIGTAIIILGMKNTLAPVNGEPGELIIEVPSSYGEPIAIAASKEAPYARDSLVTILFERGTITVEIRRGESYRLVYIDEEAEGQ